SNAAYRNTSARVAAAYASDGLNRYSAVGASSLTYDGRSNLSSTGLQSFGYDGLNRLTSTTGTTLVYDALDRLNQVVSGAGTKFLYEGQQIIAEYNGAGTLQRRYVPGPGLDNPYVWFEGTGTASNTARWLLGNAFGSIIAVGSTGAANTTLAINSYDEFGVGPTSNLGRFQYKGMTYIPEVGLYHARARTYSQYLGRFMQPDPSGYSDGMNLYAFVHNGPINGRDPSGLWGGCTSYDYFTPGNDGIVYVDSDGNLGTTPVVGSTSGSVTLCGSYPSLPPGIGQPGGGGGGHQPPKRTPPCTEGPSTATGGVSVQGYSGAGGGETAGIDEGHPFSTTRVGFGFGGGASYNPHGGLPITPANPNFAGNQRSVTFQFGFGFGLGPFAFSINADFGVAYDSNSGFGWVHSIDPEVGPAAESGFHGDASFGGQVSVYGSAPQVYLGGGTCRAHY
ncbi:MAG: RHS repeat-associated core domain-containing protein, partial [Proteobacteria bacterium]|nr:RHS repeat-associated core domain-containing protein [Pseudomonadota bacterium]